jgi:hypothetical protein
MSILSNDQAARVRFAYRVYSTGNSYGAPASTVRAANDLIDKVVEACGQVRTIDPELFTSTACGILAKLEN